jgi:hypothetical protein
VSAAGVTLEFRRVLTSGGQMTLNYGRTNLQIRRIALISPNPSNILRSYSGTIGQLRDVRKSILLAVVSRVGEFVDSLL